MRGKGKGISIFEHPIYQQISFQEFIPLPKIPKKMPPSMEVNKLFNEMITDLDTRTEKRNFYLSRTDDRKWEIYCDQVKEDAQTPSPEYLFNCLNLRPSYEVLSLIAKHISKGRISYIRRLMALNIHKHLFTLLSQYSKKFIIKNDVDPNEIISGCLLCLRNLINTKQGSNAVLQLEGVLPEIIHSMSPKAPHSIENAIAILVFFILYESQLIDNDANILIVFKCFEEENIWKMISKELLSRPDRQLLNELTTFLKGLLLYLSSNHGLRFRLVLNLTESGIFSALSQMKINQNDIILSSVDSIVKRVQTDLDTISSMFKKPMNPFTSESIVQSMVEASVLCPSVLLSISDIVVNFSEMRDQTLIFLHNFLVILRHFLSQNDPSKFQYAISLAATASKPIVVDFGSTTFTKQPAHEELYSQFHFLPDSELGTVSLAKYIKGPSSTSNESGEEDDNTLITVKEMREKLKEIKEKCEAKVKSTNEQIENIKLSYKQNQDKLAELENTSKEASDKIEEIEREKEKLEEKVKKLREKKAKIAQSNKDESTKIVEEKAALAAEITALTTAKIALANEKSAAEEELNRLKESNTEYEKEIKKIKEQLETQKSASKADKEAILELQAKLNSTESGNSSLLTQNESTQKKLNEVNALLQQEKDEKERLEEETRHNQKEIEGLKAQLEAASARIQEADESKATLHAELLQKNNTKFKEQKAEIENLKAKLNSSENQLSSLSADKKALEERLTEEKKRFDDEIESLKKRHEVEMEQHEKETQEQINELTVQLNNQGEVEAAKGQVVSLTAKVTKLQKEHIALQNEHELQMKQMMDEHEAQRKADAKKYEEELAKLRDEKEMVKVRYLEKERSQHNLFEKENQKLEITYSSKMSDLKNDHQEEMKSIKDKYKQKIHKLKETKEQLDNENTNLKAKIEDERKNAEQQLKSQLEAAEKRAAEDNFVLTNHIKKSAEKIEEQQMAISQLETTITQLKQLVKQKEGETAKVKEEMIEQKNVMKAELQNQIMAAADREAELNAKLLEQGRDLDEEVKTQMNAKAAEIKRLNDELSQTVDERDNLKTALSTLEARQKSLQSDLEQSEAQTQQLSEKIMAVIEHAKEQGAVYNENIKVMEDQLNAKTQRIAELENAMSSGTQRSEGALASLRATNDRLTACLHSAGVDISEARAKAARLEEELAKSRSALQALESEKAEVEKALEELKELQSESDAKREAASSEIENAQSKLAKKKEKIGKLKKELEESEEKLEKTKTKVDTKSRQIEELNATIEKLSNTADVDEKISQYVTEVQSLQQQNAKKDSLINDMQKKIDTIVPLQMNLKKASGQIEEQQKEITALHSELSSVKTELSSTAALLNTREEELIQVSDECNEITVQLSTAKDNLRQTEAANTQLQDKIKELDSTIEAKIQENKQLAKELEAARQDIITIREESGNASELTKALGNEKKELEARVSSLQSEINEKQSTIDEMEQQLKSVNDQREKTLIDLAATKEMVDTFKAEVAKSSAETAAEKAAKEAAEAENAKLGKKIEELNKIKESLEVDKASLTKEGESLKEAIESKESEIAELKLSIVNSHQQASSQKETEENEEEKPALLAPRENVAPPTPLRGLPWTPVEQLSTATIWASIDEIPIPEADFTKYFAAEVSTVEFVDSAKSKTIDMLLAQLDRTPQDLAQGILTIAEWLKEEHISILQSVPPSEDELKAARTYSGDQRALGQAEQLYVQLSSISLLQLHLEFLMALRTYENRLLPCEQSLIETHIGFTQLKASPRLKTVLGLVLTMGNVMNGGSLRGGKRGFSLDSLSILRTLPTNVHGQTALDFLVMHLPSPDLLSFTEDFAILASNASISLESISEHLEGVSQTLVRCMMEMPNAEPKVIDGDLFFPKFMEFYGSSRQKLDELKEALAAVKDDLKKARAAFGLPQASVGDFTTKLSDFEADLKRSHQRMLSGPVESSGSGTADSRGSTVDTERGVLDGLMANIQAGHGLFGKSDRKAEKKDSKKPGFMSFFGK